MYSSIKIKILFTTVFTIFTLLVFVACESTGTYPLGDLLTEMHYSESYRPQEGTRVKPVVNAVVFSEVKDAADPTDVTIFIQDEDSREYSPQVAKELYRVNCSVCHGLQGFGDGAVTPYLTSSDNYYAVTNNQTFINPANLQESREILTEIGIYSFIYNGKISTEYQGVKVMPAFKDLLTEEEIRDLVAYIYDTEQGLGTD